MYDPKYSYEVIINDTLETVEVWWQMLDGSEPERVQDFGLEDGYSRTVLKPDGKRGKMIRHRLYHEVCVRFNDPAGLYKYDKESNSTVPSDDVVVCQKTYPPRESLTDYDFLKVSTYISRFTDHVNNVPAPSKTAFGVPIPASLELPNLEWRDNRVEYFIPGLFALSFFIPALSSLKKFYSIYGPKHRLEGPLMHTEVVDDRDDDQADADPTRVSFWEF